MIDKNFLFRGRIVGKTLLYVKEKFPQYVGLVVDDYGVDLSWGSALCDMGTYVTGTAWIPFYFGSDRQRYEMIYGGPGRLIFAGGNVGEIPRRF